MKKLLVIFILIISIALVAIKVSRNTTINSQNTIVLTNYLFTPSQITIRKGTTITWINNDIAKHTISSNDLKTMNSPLLAKGDKYNYTFTKVGTYSYHCEPHPYMKGTIKVL